MNKPDFTLGQQVVAQVASNQFISKIEAAQLVQGVWNTEYVFDQVVIA